VGDLDLPPWPAWLLDTIETGGDGYCLHATMRQTPRTAAVLGRLQTLARRNQRDDARTQDVVHFDMNPARSRAGRLRGARGVTRKRLVKLCTKRFRGNVPVRGSRIPGMSLSTFVWAS